VFPELLQLLNPWPKGGFLTGSLDPDEERETAIDSIRATVAELERTRRREDAAGFLRLFTPDVVWVTAHGKRLMGLEQIRELIQHVLPGETGESTATSEVVDVAFVRPDVAVVNVNQRPVTDESEPLAGQPGGRPLYVMTRENGSWLIAARHNTHVREG
jgi:uncharacterized protein (TIGR02246 family)